MKNAISSTIFFLIFSFQAKLCKSTLWSRFRYF